jgi:hypothetical protein
MVGSRKLENNDIETKINIRILSPENENILQLSPVYYPEIFSRKKKEREKRIKIKNNHMQTCTFLQ